MKRRLKRNKVSSESGGPGWAAAAGPGEEEAGYRLREAGEGGRRKVQCRNEDGLLACQDGSGRGAGCRLEGSTLRL